MEIAVTEVPTRLVAVIRDVVRMDALPAFFDRAYGAIADAVGSAGGVVQGPALAWYHGMPTASVDVAAGFPVTSLEAGPLGSEGVEVVAMPGARAVTAVHRGSYDGLSDAWQEVEAWRAAHAGPGRSDFWEEYLTDPSPGGDAEANETRLVLPLA